MTDAQILDVVLKRAIRMVQQDDELHSSAYKSAKLVLTQQYGKKIFFAIMYNGVNTPFWIKFTKDNRSVMFHLPELPERLMSWKREIISKSMHNTSRCVECDFETLPKEIVHIFCSAIISALNDPKMSVGLSTFTNANIFDPEDTYEKVSIEADLMSFGNDMAFE